MEGRMKEWRKDKHGGRKEEKRGEILKKRRWERMGGRKEE